jgi:TatD DNase family protein
MIDSHCHLQDPKFAGDLELVIKRARDAGIRTLITIGYDMPSSRQAVEIAEAHGDIYATVGVHPHDAKTLTARDLDELSRIAASEKVVAIGEIGLDFYRNLSPRADQERAFRELLDLARNLQLPVVIHSRDADEEVFAILAEYAGLARHTAPEGQAVGVMHTFAGDVALARRYIEMGFAISFSGTVTYPAAEKTREVARAIPPTSMMVETDAPYLPPQAIRGQRNEPARVRDVVEYLAALRGEPPENFGRVTTRTTAQLFGLDEPGKA